jgi:hypothetical protein
MVSKTETVKKSKNGISKEKMMGLSLIPVERIKASVGKNQTLLITGKIHDEDHDDVGTTHKWGIVTEEALTRILSNGYEEDGKVILLLPEPDTDESINWVNYIPE